MDKAEFLALIRRMDDRYHEGKEKATTANDEEMLDEEFMDTEEFERLLSFSKNEELYNEYLKKEKEFKDILEYSSCMKDPYKRIKIIMDKLDGTSIELNVIRLYKILAILPSNEKAYDYFNSIIPTMKGKSCELVANIFKECGETLEDIPMEYISESSFLYAYITANVLDIPNIRDKGFLGISETRGDIIDMTKKGLKGIS